MSATDGRKILDFKLIDGQPLQLDIWSFAEPSEPKPAFIYFHGGGLSAGTRRTAIPQFLRNEAKNRGWTFISSDYRLLIPATGQDILDDVHSLFEFISTNVPQIDMNRVAVGGGSAGGYVARLAALYARPKPKVFYSLYGIGGDLFSPLYMDPPPWRDITELAKAAPMIHPTAAQKSQLKYEWNASYGPHDQVDGPAPNPVRTSLWSSLMTEGVFLDFLTGVEGLSEKVRAASKIKGELDTSSIPTEVRHLIPQFNIDASFPPSHLSHGLDDSSVLFLESTKTHEQLKATGVPNELELVPDAGHMFEWNCEDEPAIRKVVDSIARFICKYLET